MKIAIAGSGAMGSRFGIMLHKAGNEVILIDKWADHINAIKEVGLKAIAIFIYITLSLLYYYHTIKL